MPNFNRHQIRQAAFQVLFTLNANQSLELEDAYQAVLTMDQFDAEEVTPVEVPAYLAFLVSGVTENQAALDAALTPYLKKGWQLSRLAKPDLIILRLGLFEMQSFRKSCAWNCAQNQTYCYYPSDSSAHVAIPLCNINPE